MLKPFSEPSAVETFRTRQSVPVCGRSEARAGATEASAYWSAFLEAAINVGD